MNAERLRAKSNIYSIEILRKHRVMATAAPNVGTARRFPSIGFGGDCLEVVTFVGKWRVGRLNYSRFGLVGRSLHCNLSRAGSSFMIFCWSTVVPEVLLATMGQSILTQKFCCKLLC